MQFNAKSEESNDGKFVRLKDGDVLEGVFRGDPWDYKVHWDNGKSVDCVGQCDWCKKGDDPKFRFKINVVVKENEMMVAKVYQGGWKVYSQLEALHTAGYNLEKTRVTVTRKGADWNNTTYTVLPVPNGTLGEAELRLVSDVKLWDLLPKLDSEVVTGHLEAPPF